MPTEASTFAKYPWVEVAGPYHAEWRADRAWVAFLNSGDPEGDMVALKIYDGLSEEDAREIVDRANRILERHRAQVLKEHAD